MEARLEEIEAVYRLRGGTFERTAIAIVGDAQLGADVVHDAFVIAIRKRRSFRGDAPLEAWLWRIVINEARKRGARETFRLVADPAELDRAGDEPEDASDREHVRALVAALPERQRLVLFLRHYADLDYATIGHVLAVEPGTVAATLSAARRRLREQLQEVHEWER